MKLGLVLSGGGPAGAFEVGVVGALEEAGLRPSVLSGTSAGAVNAAAVASGWDAARLTDLWLGLSDDDVYHLRMDVWNAVRPAELFSWSQDNLAERLLAASGWTWLLDTAPLRRTLVRVLSGEAVAPEPDVVLAVSAVEIETGELVRFVSAPPPRHRRTPAYRVVDLTVDHVLASAAVPLLFKPAEVGDTTFWDGGIIANTPLAPVFAYEPDAIVVVLNSTVPRPAPRPQSLSHAIALLLRTVIGFSLKHDIEHARAVNDLARRAPDATDRRYVDLIVVAPPPGEPSLEIGIGLDRRETARLIALLCEELGVTEGGDVLDLAAGTGKLTRLLAPTGARVVAVEPVEGMRRVLEQVLPDVRALDGTAERIPMPDASVDAVFVGQAFHWFDAPAALAEIARVLRPGGGLALLWNVRDEASDWVAEVTRVLDRYAADSPRHRNHTWRAAFDSSPHFAPLEKRRFAYVQHSTLAGQRDRFGSISFVACLPTAKRNALLDEIFAIVAPYAAPDGSLAIPYRTDVYWTRRE